MALFGGIELVGRPDLEQIRRLDLMCMPMISKMERYGIGIDIAWMEELSSKLEQEMIELRYDICSYIPPEKLDEFVARSKTNDDLPMNVDSRDQLSTLLFDTLNIGRGRAL